VQGRIIDLSKKAAKKIDMINAGVAEVELKYKKKK
jgi:rare lipoprotein A